MAFPLSPSTSSRLSNHVGLVSNTTNQYEHDASARDALRYTLLQQGFVAKPTAYAPHKTQEDHPLDDPHRQLQARLHALRDVRRRLTFVELEKMPIATRVALSAPPTASSDWIQRGGIVALDGLEPLVLAFLSTHELVTAGAVCQSWYALARRDELWEPLLHTPLENYPLRPFLGFDASVPAIQVYIIYRKIRTQLQTLDPKDDETPRQSPDAVRFEELLLRFRRAGNNNQDEMDHDVVEEEMALLARAPLRRSRRLTNGTRRVHGTSVHLVFPADEDLEHGTVEEVGGRETQPPVPPMDLQLDDQAAFQAMVDVESDDELAPDVVMVGPDGETPDEATVSPSVSVLAACRRIRLQTWLSQRRVVSSDELRALARQLLLALTTLEAAQLTHSDVSVGNVLVLDRGATNAQAMVSGTTPGLVHSANQTESTVHFPLFQLYCRSSVNTWSVEPGVRTLRDLAANPPPVRGANADFLALRMRHRHRHLLAGAGAAAAEGPDVEDHPLFRRLLMPRALGRINQDVNEEVDPIPPPLPVLLAPPEAPTSATFTNMVRSYLRILREVWCHGRIATTNERSLPFLTLLYLRHDLIKSASFRSFIEYAEYLISRNDASPSELLKHIYMHEDSATSASPRGGRRATPMVGLVVGRSPLNPSNFASADEYRTQVIVWHVRRRVARIRPLLGSLRVFGTLRSIPSTLFGPSFFHDALSESRLPCQRFLSVTAPRTATSSWVHTLAVSQRFTLQQLDLSRVQLPLSILLRELHHLQRLSHLRLPRAILRDENLEQFIAALWCAGLLPTLHVMDETIKHHLDRLEAGYESQLRIMTSFLDENRKHASSLMHPFSSPF